MKQELNSWARCLVLCAVILYSASLIARRVDHAMELDIIAKQLNNIAVETSEIENDLSYWLPKIRH